MQRMSTHAHYPATVERELPVASPRRQLHSRTITMKGYQRDDGLFDIDGELRDSKHHPWPSWELGVQPPGQPVHHLCVRLTLDVGYGVHAVAAALPAIPFDECRGTLPPLGSLVGATVSRGWRKAVEAALGGPAGCTHVRELLMAMGTVAYQTIAGEQRRAAFEALPPSLTQLPAPTAVLPHWGRCVSWALDGEVLRRVAPGVVTPPSGDMAKR